ncbi:hypothetical protein RFI_02427, partial [Reticulomyxa filosa]
MLLIISLVDSIVKRNIYLMITTLIYLKKIAQRLNEKQMNIALNYCMDKLNDKNEHQNNRIKCIELFETISNKCNEQQLNNSLMDILHDEDDHEEYFDDAFQCLINGLKDGDSTVQQSCVKSLVTISKKWNDKQLDITFQCLIDGFENINGYDCYTPRYLLEGIEMKLNEIQIDS